MPSSEQGDLAAYIDELIAATKLGKISWKVVNPTTFVWETPVPKSARISLQRVERIVAVQIPAALGRPPSLQQRREVNYLFQVFDLAQSALPILNLDSSSEPQLNERFDALFNIVKTGVSEKTMEFLKSILPR